VYSQSHINTAEVTETCDNGSLSYGSSFQNHTAAKRHCGINSHQKTQSESAEEEGDTFEKSL
jgi:hypothetical protein